MPVWLWILGVLAALLVLLCRTRVGVRAAFGAELTLDIVFGRFHFRVLPLKQKDPKKTRKRKNTGGKKSEPEKSKEKKPFPMPGLRDIQDAVKTLRPPLEKTLGRLGRGIRLDPLQLRLIVGGKTDPASAAELYGYLHGGVWTVMPQLERLMDIPNPYIHLDIDFTSSQNQVQGEAGVTLRAGTIFLMAFGMGIPALRWFLRFIKRKKGQAKEAASQSEKEQKAA